MKNLYLYAALSMNAIFMLFLVVSGPDGAVTLFGAVLLGLASMLAIVVMVHSVKRLIAHFNHETKNKRIR